MAWGDSSVNTRYSLMGSSSGDEIAPSRKGGAVYRHPLVGHGREEHDEEQDDRAEGHRSPCSTAMVVTDQDANDGRC